MLILGRESESQEREEATQTSDTKHINAGLQQIREPGGPLPRGHAAVRQRRERRAAAPGVPDIRMCCFSIQINRHSIMLSS